MAIRTFWFEDGAGPLRHRRRHHLGLDARPASGPRPSSRPAACCAVASGDAAAMAGFGRGVTRSVRRLVLDRRRPRGRRQASVVALDHGLTVGDGVFETLKVVGGEPFAARRHLDRLAPLGRRPAACRAARPTTSCAAAMATVVAANGAGRGRLRLTVTGGLGPLGSDRGDRRTDGPRRGRRPARLGADRPRWSPSPWRRNERSARGRPQDHVLRRERRRPRRRARARRRRGDLRQHRAASCARAPARNVFVVLDGRLLTPPLSSGCLAGITRELVCEAGRRRRARRPAARGARGSATRPS